MKTASKVAYDIFYGRENGLSPFDGAKLIHEVTMGMSTHVRGFRPPDEKWRKMKAVWDASEAAGIEPPKEVSEFFEYNKPDPAGVEVKIQVRECRPHDGASGYEVDIASLPKDVTVIRFWNAW